MAPGGLAGVLELHVRIGWLEAVLRRLGLEGRNEARGGLLGCHLRGVMRLLGGRLVGGLGMVDYIVSVYLCVDIRFYVLSGIGGVKRAYVRLHLRGLRVSVVLSASGVSCWSLGVSWGAAIDGVWLLCLVCCFRIGIFEQIVVAIGAVEYLLVLLLLHWTSGRVC